LIKATYFSKRKFQAVLLFGFLTGRFFVVYSTINIILVINQF